MRWRRLGELWRRISRKCSRDVSRSFAEGEPQMTSEIHVVGTDGYCSYRRGKPESNDVDIVFTHAPGKGQEKLAADLCTKLVIQLKEAGRPWFYFLLSVLTDSCSA